MYHGPPLARSFLASADSPPRPPAADRRRHARAASRARAVVGGRARPLERDRSPARLSLRLSYTQALQEAGAIAVVLPTHGYVDDIGALLDRLDGLLFSGGPGPRPGDLRRGAAPAARHGRRPRRRRVRARACSPKRPRATCRCSRSAAACRRSTSPAAGRCTSTSPTARSSSTARRTSRYEPAHAVTVTRRTRRCIASPAGAGCTVNSFHHQADRPCSASGCRSARTRPTGRRGAVRSRRRASASACSGTPSCSRTAPSTRRCSARW